MATIRRNSTNVKTSSSTTQPYVVEVMLDGATAPFNVYGMILNVAETLRLPSPSGEIVEVQVTPELLTSLLKKAQVSVKPMQQKEHKIEKALPF